MKKYCFVVLQILLVTVSCESSKANSEDGGKKDISRSEDVRAPTLRGMPSGHGIDASADPVSVQLGRGAIENSQAVNGIDSRPETVARIFPLDFSFDYAAFPLHRTDISHLPCKSTMHYEHDNLIVTRIFERELTDGRLELRKVGPTEDVAYWERGPNGVKAFKVLAYSDVFTGTLKKTGWSRFESVKKSLEMLQDESGFVLVKHTKENKLAMLVSRWADFGEYSVLTSVILTDDGVSVGQTEYIWFTDDGNTVVLRLFRSSKPGPTTSQDRVFQEPPLAEQEIDEIKNKVDKEVKEAKASYGTYYTAIHPFDQEGLELEFWNCETAP